MIETIKILFSPPYYDSSEEGEYGRDFFSDETGFGRLTMANRYNNRVEFSDAEWPEAYLPSKDPRVDVDDEDSARATVNYAILEHKDPQFKW